MRRTTLAVCLAVLVLSGCDWLPPSMKPVTKPTTNDSFTGEVQAVFLTPPTPSDDYRDMKLLAKFGYLDPYGVYWEVPAGYVTNGASIPWYLWPALGGPYDGPYRDAAVLHDYYCDKQMYTWEKTHEMFYNASLRRGVSETKAKTMYLGLQIWGVRWPPPKPTSSLDSRSRRHASFTLTPMREESARVPVQTRPTAPAGRVPTDEEKQIFEELKGWIEREKPTLEQIQKKVEEMRAQRNLRAPPTAPKK